MSNNGPDYKVLVLQATDIVELIGQSVALKRRGKDYVGLCPFHQEKTPSFHVSPTKQYFRCYGCKAGGNAIDFVMRRDRIEFLDALKALGQRAGVEMPKFGMSKEKTSERQALLETQSAACSLFEKSLAHPEIGAAGRAYLQKRGINAESIRKFQIGLAMDAWDGLLKSPMVRKFPPGLLATAGLVKTRESNNGFYDTFRNRLMFPIRDEVGRIIAFGGRVMPGSQDPAKYLNSPETPLFSKSRCVFGLDLAKQRIAETRMVAVVEGYTDVVMAHQFGVTNVVSILGTALTEQHVTMLRRFADRIVLLFDADNAGDLAVNRAVELFLTQPVEIAVASMPDGVDPDEFLLQQGAEAFENVLKNVTDVLTYKWKELDRQYTSSAGDMTGQQKAVEEYLGILANARGTGPVDPLRWGAAIARVSRLTEIPVDELNRRFKNRKAPAKRPTIRTPDPAESNAAQVADSPVPTQGNRSKPMMWTARDRAERWLLGAMLLEGSLWHRVQQEILPEHFEDADRRKLAERYWEHQRNEGEPILSEFLTFLSDRNLTELAVEMADEVEGMGELAMIVQDAMAHLQELRGRGEDQKLMAGLRRTNGTQPPEQQDDEISVLKKLQERARRPDLRRAL